MIRLLPEPMDCPLPARLLEQTCGEPEQVPDGASYAQVLQAAARDRDALRRCAAQQQLLADTLRSCNTAIGDYRRALRQSIAEPAQR